MEIHVVRAGETLYGIAGAYGMDLRLLRELNGTPPEKELLYTDILIRTKYNSGDEI